MRMNRYSILGPLVLLLASIPTPVVASFPIGDEPATIEFGDTGTLPDYELRIIDVAWDAERILRVFDPSMGDMSDTAWIMVQIEATYTGTSTGTPADDIDFTLRDITGDSWDLFRSACDRWPMPPESVTLAPGEASRYNLCFQIPLHAISPHGIVTTDETEITVPPAKRMVLVAHSRVLTDQWPATFSLVRPTSDLDVPDCACVPPPPCGCMRPTPPIGRLG